MPEKNKAYLTTIKNYLSEDLLGQIPLFFKEVSVQALNSSIGEPSIYSREIEVQAYQTKAFESRAYHKAISKII